MLYVLIKIFSDQEREILVQTPDKKESHSTKSIFMKTLKKLLFTGSAIFFLSLMNVSSSTAQVEEEVGDDGATTVVCTCKGAGKCVANGDGGSQCNASNKCANWNSNCG